VTYLDTAGNLVIIPDEQYLASLSDINPQQLSLMLSVDGTNTLIMPFHYDGIGHMSSPPINALCLVFHFIKQLLPPQFAFMD
jgi:hypothetical protein